MNKQTISRDYTQKISALIFHKDLRPKWTPSGRTIEIDYNLIYENLLFIEKVYSIETKY